VPQMAAVTIRRLDDSVKERLRVRAAQHGRSMEAEIRAILADAVAEDDQPGLFQVLGDRFQAVGGVDLELPERRASPRSMDFGS
jgi:plasmid stability protein